MLFITLHIIDVLAGSDRVQLGPDETCYSLHYTSLMFWWVPIGSSWGPAKCRETGQPGESHSLWVCVRVLPEVVSGRESPAKEIFSPGMFLT